MNAYAVFPASAGSDIRAVNPALAPRHASAPTPISAAMASSFASSPPVSATAAQSSAYCSRGMRGMLGRSARGAPGGTPPYSPVPARARLGRCMATGVVRFGPFRLDTVEWRLTRDGAAIVVQDKVLVLLD